MDKITTKIFADGIAIYDDDKEIAFYSNITKKIRYNNDESSIGCAEISFSKNAIIIYLIKRYIKNRIIARK